LNCSASDQNGEIVNVCKHFRLNQLAILTAFQVPFLGSTECCNLARPVPCKSSAREAGSRQFMAVHGCLLMSH
jgi:hypothetical protein